MLASSGYASGPYPTPHTAIAAVSSAMSRGGFSQAGKVILFLSAHFHGKIQSCLRAVAQVSNCLDVCGASAAGVFTEQDWSLDSPAAAAMVLPPEMATTASSCLTLAAPNAINAPWLRDGTPRFGAIAGDATGRGNYALWQNARPCADHLDIPLPPCRMALSEGLRNLCGPLEVTSSNGLLVESLNGRPALEQLLPWLHAVEPEYLVAGISEACGDRRWIPLIGIDQHNGGIMLAQALPAGAQMELACFDSALASAELEVALIQALAGQARPQWALAFSGHRRGMAGSGIQEPDWETLRKTLPDIPFAGFYGNGQIMPLAKTCRVLDNSVIAALFS